MIRRLGTTAFILLLVHPAAARAQSNVEVNAGIQFDFLNPGARSLALGSAFTAIADDATTAFTNPAGLRALTRKEISFEGRFRNFETPFTLRGRAFGTPTGFGTDTQSGLVDAINKENIGAASFLSFVYPSSRWAIAAYRHEVARFKNEIRTEGAYVETQPNGDIYRLFPAQGSLDLKVVDYGVSGSYSITDRASIGAGIVIYDFSQDSLVQRYNTGLQPANYTRPFLTNYQTQSGDDTQIGVNIGFAAKPTDKVQVGFVYRKGAAFDVNVTNVNAETTPETVVVDETGQFRIPDVFSGGVMVRVNEPLRFAVDVTHIRYSQLTKQFVDVFYEESDLYEIDDGTEFHAGAEYFLTNLKVPVAFRGGFWYDPSHSLRYAGPRRDLQTIFRDRDDAQMHYTGGAGFVVNQFELNVGFDISKTIKTTSFSTVVRF